MEHHYIQLVLHYLKSHPNMGFLFTFIVAFSESLPLIGTIIPGSVTMTIIGVLVGMGAMSPTLTLTIASISAFLGDCIGFILGYTYNDQIRTIWPFKKNPHWLLTGEKFVAKHGGKSIVLGRFIGPARSTVPLVAGLLKLSWPRFILAAIPSAFLWAVMYTVPGIMIGALSQEVPKGETTRFFLYGIGILATVWLCFWLIQHFFIQLARFINHITDRCWHCLSHKKITQPLIRLITNHQQPSDHHQLTMLLTGALSGILFLILLAKVRIAGVLTAFNHPLFHLLQSIRTPIFDKLFVIITIMGTPKTIMTISLLTTAILCFLKQWRTAMHLLAGFILSAGAVIVFKKISHSMRPQGFEIVASSSSFPSGHTTLSLVVFSLIAFLISQTLQEKNRWIPWVISTALVLFVAFSRLYLGAHWLTDIIGSFLLGTSIIAACIISYRRMPKAQSGFSLPYQTAILTMLTGMIIPLAIAIPLSYHYNIVRYTPIWHKNKTSIESWWKNPLDYTPLYRNDRFGRPFQPFNIQWQGSITTIKKALTTSGWKPAHNSQKLKAAIERFSTNDARYHLPIFSRLYRNKPPILFLIKPVPHKNQVIEIRLWLSNLRLKQSKYPVFLGATDVVIPPKTLFSLKASNGISLKNGAGLNTLSKDITQFERKWIVVPASKRPTAIKKQHWNGKILVLREPTEML